MNKNLLIFQDKVRMNKFEMLTNFILIKI